MDESLTGGLFQGWAGPVRTLVIGALAYLSLLILLRAAGKRTLSKMNAFDFVVTVALGSILATILLSKSVALVEAIAAFCLLIGMQYAITWLSVRSSRVSGLVKSEPRLLMYRGEFLRESMKDERVNEEEVHAAIRSQGAALVEYVAAVVLETDGTFSVVRSHSKAQKVTSLTGVRREVT